MKISAEDSWHCGFTDAYQGKGYAPPPGCDRLAYASGRVEGAAERDKALQAK